MKLNTNICQINNSSIILIGEQIYMYKKSNIEKNDKANKIYINLPSLNKLNINEQDRNIKNELSFCNL